MTELTPMQTALMRTVAGHYGDGTAILKGNALTIAESLFDSRMMMWHSDRPGGAKTWFVTTKGWVLLQEAEIRNDQL